MVTVGVRELKARLSACLREVQAGQVLLVTDRGKVVAELRKPGTSSVALVPEEPGIQRLVNRGKVRLARRPGDHAWLRPTGIRLARGSTKSLLDAERGE